MSTTGKRMGTVSISGRICVEMNARDVNMVAAQRSDSLVTVSVILTNQVYCLVEKMVQNRLSMKA